MKRRSIRNEGCKLSHGHLSVGQIAQRRRSGIFVRNLSNACAIIIELEISKGQSSLTVIIEQGMPPLLQFSILDTNGSQVNNWQALLLFFI
jgi:hypothetical protein